MSRARGVEVALAAAVVSGVAVYLNGLAVRRFDDATTYTVAKNLVAGTVLLAVLLGTGGARRSVPELQGTVRRSWPGLAVLAVVGGSVPFVLFFEGLARATSTNAAFVHKTLVVWVAIGAAVALGERVTALHVGAIGLLVVGHLVLTGGIVRAGLGQAELLVLAATLLWAVEVVVAKRVLAAVPAQVAATTRMVGGSAVLLAWLGVTGRLDALLAFDARQWGWVLLTGATLAVFVTTWYAALALAPAVDVTAVLVLGALVTGLLDMGAGGVATSPDAVGYALITLGVALVVGRALPAPRTRAPA